MADMRLYQSVAERLKKRIARGSYKPGDRLPGERELAEELNVSRVTIREAQIALQAMGHIRIKAGSGAYVNKDVAPAGLDIPAVSALELTQARLLFESEAAALAARAVSDDDLARLEQLVEVMSESHPDNERVTQDADREFHLTIAAASGNAAVQHTIETLWRMRTELSAVREAHSSVCSERMAAERGREHSDILAALKQRDPVAARATMQNHFTRLLASMIDASEARAVEEQRIKAAASRQRFLDSTKQNKSA